MACIDATNGDPERIVSAMKVFVTGGSGFVGGHVIEQLSARGHQVAALARSSASEAKVCGYGASAVRGDLDDVSTDAMRGFDAIVHCAAHAQASGRREEFWRINVEGTARVLDAARAAGVKRFVHVGTEAAFFVGED